MIVTQYDLGLLWFGFACGLCFASTQTFGREQPQIIPRPCGFRLTVLPSLSKPGLVLKGNSLRLDQVSQPLSCLVVA